MRPLTRPLWLSTGPWAGSSERWSSGRGPCPLGPGSGRPPRPPKEASWRAHSPFCCLLTTWYCLSHLLAFILPLDSAFSHFSLLEAPAPLSLKAAVRVAVYPQGCCASVGRGREPQLQGSSQLGAAGRMGPCPEEGHLGLFPVLHFRPAVRERLSPSQGSSGPAVSPPLQLLHPLHPFGDFNMNALHIRNSLWPPRVTHSLSRHSIYSSPGESTRELTLPDPQDVLGPTERWGECHSPLWMNC